jgi:hypothetical protein
VRTTLTIDDDIAVHVKRQARKTGEPLKAVVNRYLRLGIMADLQPQKSEPFEVKPFPLGLKPGLSYDSIQEVLEGIDGPYRR